MKVAVFSTKSYDREFLAAANGEFGHELVFFEPRLTWQTSPLAAGFPAVCAFVNDQLDAHVLVTLAKQSTRLIAMRCAGFNNVDLRIADEMGLTVVRVPAYSPHAVAEHTVGLMLALNRRLYKAYNRVREGNFALEGLLGFEFHGLTVGVIGTGKIGVLVARIMRGFGCEVLACDVAKNAEVEACGVSYVKLDDLLARSDVITLHCPLVPDTYHLIGGSAGQGEAGRDDRQHQPRRADRHPRSGASVEVGRDRLAGDGRLRGGSRLVLPGPFRPRDPGRHVFADADFPQRADYRPSGFFHPQRPGGDRPGNAGQYRRVRERGAAAGPHHGGAGAVSWSGSLQGHGPGVARPLFNFACPVCITLRQTTRPRFLGNRSQAANVVFRSAKAGAAFARRKATIRAGPNPGQTDGGCVNGYPLRNISRIFPNPGTLASIRPRASDCTFVQ